MIAQCAWIFLFLALGEAIVWFTGVKIPSSIIGMLMFTLALSLGLVKENQVDKACGFLLKYLGFFFVPAGVGLVTCLGLIKTQWLPIAAATMLSTLIVLTVTGHTHRLIRKLSKRNGVSDK